MGRGRHDDLSDSGWVIAAASATGSAHAARGEPCQDAYAWRRGPDGALFAAVADGAGSAPRSGDGARWAAAAAVESLARSNGWSAPGVVRASGVGAMLDAIAAARTAIEARRDPSDALRAHACTLTCAAALADRLVVGQVGDSLAVARRPDGAFLAVSRPQKGEYANESAFLTAPDWRRTADVRTWTGPFDGLALFTDGLLRLALSLPGYRPHRPFFVPLMDFVASAPDPEEAGRALGAFLDSPRVLARTDDDKTLVVAIRRTAAPVP